MKIKNNFQHLYIHVPFCKKICDYCDFYKTIDTTKTDPYFLRLEEELIKFQSNLQSIKTIFIGGGTPNVFSNDDLENFFSILEKYLDTKVSEFTTESNPEFINLDQIKIWKKYHINRISIGIQSTNSNLLANYNRYQDQELENKIMLIKEYFTNVSFDFIYNFPGQTLEDIKNDLAFIAKHNPDHISWYSLILKDKTMLKHKNIKLDEDNEILFADFIKRELKKLGYENYEVSNFAKNKKYAWHNLAYWTSKDWLGVGPSAATFFYDNEEKCYVEGRNTESIDNWVCEYENLSSQTAAAQIIYMNLRLQKGCELTNERIQESINILWNKIVTLEETKLIEKEGNYMKVTKKGKNLLNDIFEFMLE
ncbi:hypothetical protein ASO20_02880 [Mycoplasma sp. (ex Biomphalaria glabrata)]|uniref:radical SAM family heme chaperone HemW n=1 Tax=Mycoplasma sp. (ex Biomphalaria glabrata) TaxID=1749074 RepID=UPI00073A9C1D|nr:radical SAM family heme chaperone HemW [Mycoplasma sp. (ex Biomphalaria glabrata)]ALV23578.1 hypothetical protein ASO20_02880 [Mycoplasma sp. (ex Biomphalaria glabrata)]